MKYGILLICSLFLFSCIDRDKKYYSSLYNNNKDEFFFLSNSLRHLMSRNDSLYAYSVERTGKSFNQYSFNSDSTQWYFNGIRLSDDMQKKFSKLMYKNDLTNIWTYRDSVRFFFKGIKTEVITMYFSNSRTRSADMIDSNVVLFFNQLNR